MALAQKKNLGLQKLKRDTGYTEAEIIPGSMLLDDCVSDIILRDGVAPISKAPPLRDEALMDLP